MLGVVIAGTLSLSLPTETEVRIPAVSDTFPPEGMRFGYACNRELRWWLLTYESWAEAYVTNDGEPLAVDELEISLDHSGDYPDQYERRTNASRVRVSFTYTGIPLTNQSITAQPCLTYSEGNASVHWCIEPPCRD